MKRILPVLGDCFVLAAHQSMAGGARTREACAFDLQGHRPVRGPSRGLRGQAPSPQVVPFCTATVVQFSSAVDNVDGVFTEGDATATVTGNLADGTPIQGTDAICIVP